METLRCVISENFVQESIIDYFIAYSSLHVF